MRRAIRVVLLMGLLGGVLLLSTGCLFNIFQTARMLGAGNTALTIGTGLMDIDVDGGDPNWNLAPQARFAVGLSDTANLGFQTGALVPLSTGEFNWLGIKGDVTFAVVDDPETFSLALGLGAGYGIEFLNVGIFGEVLFSVNSTLPLFIVYQPTVPLNGNGFTLLHHVAGGLALPLSEKATILLVVDWRNGLLSPSYGIGIEIGF